MVFVQRMFTSGTRFSPLLLEDGDYYFEEFQGHNHMVINTTLSPHVMNGGTPQARTHSQKCQRLLLSLPYVGVRARLLAQGKGQEEEPRVHPDERPRRDGGALARVLQEPRV